MLTRFKRNGIPCLFRLQQRPKRQRRGVIPAQRSPLRNALISEEPGAPSLTGALVRGPQRQVFVVGALARVGTTKAGQPKSCPTQFQLDPTARPTTNLVMLSEAKHLLLLRTINGLSVPGRQAAQQRAIQTPDMPVFVIDPGLFEMQQRRSQPRIAKFLSSLKREQTDRLRR